jgi:hypothetical protein
MLVCCLMNLSKGSLLCKSVCLMNLSKGSLLCKSVCLMNIISFESFYKRTYKGSCQKLICLMNIKMLTIMQKCMFDKPFQRFMFMFMLMILLPNIECKCINCYQDVCINMLISKKIELIRYTDCNYLVPFGFDIYINVSLNSQPHNIANKNDLTVIVFQCYDESKDLDYSCDTKKNIYTNSQIDDRYNHISIPFAPNTIGMLQIFKRIISPAIYCYDISIDVDKNICFKDSY